MVSRHMTLSYKDFQRFVAAVIFVQFRFCNVENVAHIGDAISNSGALLSINCKASP